jgi:benzoylformate decarboxylase
MQSAAERKAQLSQDNWTTRRAKAVKTVMASQATVQPITPANLIWRITEHLPSDAIVVEEALTSTQPLPQFLHQRDPSSWFGLASGGLGFAIPGAVGISLAKPGRPVVAIVGDGSAMYGIQGLWTAAHLKLPITYVIANNRGYRIIKERLVSMQGSNRFIGMDIREPDIQFATLAQSMGLQATQITDPQDLGDALKAAMASGRPNLIEVFVADGFGT